MKLILFCLLIGLAAAGTATTEHLSVNSTVTAVVIAAGVFGIVFAYFQYHQVAKVQLKEGAQTRLLTNESNHVLLEIYTAIREGAQSFLKAEYRICCIFVVIFGLIVFILTSRNGDAWHFDVGGLTAFSFVVGAVTSMLSGYIGMMVAVFANARTTLSAMTHNRWTDAFNCAFRAGGVMGFSLTGLASIMLYVLCVGYNQYFSDSSKLFECIAGFGLGGSSIAMFGRVGGGIYTKAADVGADLAGKVVNDIPEDCARNPATIADNVGDNVGDVAGMGSDLFG